MSMQINGMYASKVLEKAIKINKVLTSNALAKCN